MFPGVRGAGPDWSCGPPTTGHPSPAPGEATSSPVQSSPVQSSLETESSVWCFSSHCPVVGRIRSSGHNRFNCFLCNFDLCESCVYRKAQRPSLVGNILKTFIFLALKTNLYYVPSWWEGWAQEAGEVRSGSGGGAEEEQTELALPSHRSSYWGGGTSPVLPTGCHCLTTPSLNITVLWIKNNHYF